MSSEILFKYSLEDKSTVNVQYVDFNACCGSDNTQLWCMPFRMRRATFNF